MRRRKRKDAMVWLDLEMTGLDPRKERIIEIATVITDKYLNTIAEGPNLAIHQGPKILNAMDSWNKKQHHKSGLIEEVKKSKITVKEAERKTLRFLKQYCLVRKSPLCGNSVHHDRLFLAKYMPKLHRFIHYRHVDVSTLKELTKRWYSPRKNIPPKKEAHRALEDIKESIEELRFYRKRYFKKLKRKPKF